MEKFIIDSSRGRVFAHARRISTIDIKKDDIIVLSDNRFAYKIETEVDDNRFELVDVLPV